MLLVAYDVVFCVSRRPRACLLCLGKNLAACAWKATGQQHHLLHQTVLSFARARPQGPRPCLLHDEVALELLLHRHQRSDNLLNN